MQLAACAGDWAYVLLNTGYFIYIYLIYIFDSFKTEK